MAAQQLPVLVPLVPPMATPVPMHMLPNPPMDQAGAAAAALLGAPIVLTNPTQTAVLPVAAAAPKKSRKRKTQASNNNNGGGVETEKPRKPTRVRTPGEVAAAAARKKPDISLGLRVWPASTLEKANASIPDGPVVYQRCMESVTNGGTVVLKQVEPFVTPLVTVYPKAFAEKEAKDTYTLLEAKTAWTKPIKPASESRMVCLWSKDGKEYQGKQGGIPTVPFSDILSYVQSQVAQYNDYQGKEPNFVVGHRLQTENKAREGKPDILADQTVDGKELVAGTDFHIVSFGQSRILTLHPKSKAKPKKKESKEGTTTTAAPVPEVKASRQPPRQPLLKIELKHGSYVRFHSPAFNTAGVTLAYSIQTTMTDLDVSTEFSNALVLMGRTLAPPQPKVEAAPPVVPPLAPAAPLPGIPTPTVPIAMPPLEQAVPMVVTAA